MISSNKTPLSFFCWFFLHHFEYAGVLIREQELILVLYAVNGEWFLFNTAVLFGESRMFRTDVTKNQGILVY